MGSIDAQYYSATTWTARCCHNELCGIRWLFVKWWFYAPFKVISWALGPFEQKKLIGELFRGNPNTIGSFHFFLQIAVWKENMLKFTYTLWMDGQFCGLIQLIINNNWIIGGHLAPYNGDNCILKNPAYGRLHLPRPLRIETPIPINLRPAASHKNRGSRTPPLSSTPGQSMSLTPAARGWPWVQSGRTHWF